jgi:hypothetical protein
VKSLAFSVVVSAGMSLAASRNVIVWPPLGITPSSTSARAAIVRT